MGKTGPIPEGCGENQGPYFVVVLDSGPATAVVLRLVWPGFLSQRLPRES